LSSKCQVRTAHRLWQSSLNYRTNPAPAGKPRHHPGA